MRKDVKIKDKIKIMLINYHEQLQKQKNGSQTRAVSLIKRQNHDKDVYRGKRKKDRYRKEVQTRTEMLPSVDISLSFDAQL